MTEPKWTACGKNGCVNGFVSSVATQEVLRYRPAWVADEVGGEGKFIHHETGQRTKYHRPTGVDDPDFEVVKVEVLEATKCVCHPTHWSLSA